MQPADPQLALAVEILPEGEKRVVAEGEERAAEGGKDPEFVVGPFDRDVSALRSAMISSRSWNERPPTST